VAVITVIGLIIYLYFEGRHLSANYAECSREFTELKKNFNKVKTSASSMLDYIRKNSQLLVTLSGRINIANQVTDAKLRTKICSAFSRLCQKFPEIGTKQYQSKLANIDQRFRGKVEEIFRDVMECCGDG